MRSPVVALVALALIAAGSAIALLAPAWDDAAVEAVWGAGERFGIARFARDVTALGGHTVVLALMLAVAVGLACEGRRRLAAVALVQGGGAMVLNVAIKALVMRPRPDLGIALEIATTSFPSGHSLLAAAAWPWLGHLLGAGMREARTRAWLAALGGAIAALVAVSRMTLGLHRPSEVLAGLGFGLGWGWLCARWAARPVTARTV